MKIGELSGRTGVPVETIRYYERIGLLPAPPRRPSGFREFDGDAADRLGFIRRAQRLGFSLDAVGTLLALRGAPDAAARARGLAAARLAALDAEIDVLARTRAALARLVGACPGTGPAAGCPILRALDGDGEEAGNPVPGSRA